jgi:hypothetical protein
MNMSGDYSISLNGFFAAERNLFQAAQRIATGNLPDPSDVMEANQAKVAAEANLKALTTQQALDREALDLFA